MSKADINAKSLLLANSDSCTISGGREGGEMRFVFNVKSQCLIVLLHTFSFVDYKISKTLLGSHIEFDLHVF